jgi:hypothetical protein
MIDECRLKNKQAETMGLRMGFQTINIANTVQTRRVYKRVSWERPLDRACRLLKSTGTAMFRKTTAINASWLGRKARNMDYRLQAEGEIAYISSYPAVGMLRFRMAGLGQ